MQENEIQNLLKKYLAGDCNANERALIESWYLQHEAKDLPALNDKQLEVIASSTMKPRTDAQVVGRSVDRVKVRKMRSYMKWTAAAVALLSLSLGIYFYKIEGKKESSNSKEYEILVHDVAPGGNKAYLTLEDGRNIDLHEGQSGIVVCAGQLTYNDGTSLTTVAEKEVNYMLTTPKGGQYQITLSDGTKVWLNADSKISYPSHFDGTERLVKMEGEVYFEVAKKPGKTFVVQLPDGERIEVLGTHFNVNAYAERNSVRTTLIEGIVRVLNADKREVLLKPNQQAIQRKVGGDIKIATVDVDNIIAWKNNKFNFDGLRFDEIMKQIERWYNVEVEYKNRIPNIEFYGEIGRQNTLLYVLQVFENSGVKLQLQGNKLFVY